MTTTTAKGDTAARCFLEGLVKPSLISVVTALVVTASIGLLLLGVSQLQVASFLDKIGASNQADAYLISSRAIKLASVRPTPSGLILLGASTTRESFDEDIARNLLSDHPRVSIIDLTASGETIVEAVGLADAIPDDFRGIVIFGVNCIRMSRTPERANFTNPRFGNYSATLKDEAVRLGLPIEPDTGFYAVDQRAFLLRLWGDLREKPKWLLRVGRKPKRHLYRNKQRSEAELVKGMGPASAKVLTRAATAYRTNFDIIGRMIKRLEKNGVKVVLLESPINPRFVAEALGTDQYRDYLALMRSFANSSGATFLDLNAEAELQPSDFYDHGHLRAAAATDRFTRLLIGHVRPMILEQIRD